MVRVYATEDDYLQDGPKAPPKPVSKRVYAGTPEADALPEVEDQPIEKSALHGLTQFGFDTSKIVGAIADWVLTPPRTSVESARMGVTGKQPDDKSPDLYDTVARAQEETNKTFQREGYYREPATTWERSISGAARGLPMLPIAANSLGAPGVISELAATLYGPFVGEYTTDALTPEGQEPSAGAQAAGTAAEIISTLPAAFVGGPTAAGTIKGMRAKTLAQSAPAEAVNLLNIINRRAKRMWDAMYSGVKDAPANPPEFNLADLYDVVSYYKGKFPTDPDGKINYHAVAADMLDDSLRESAGPGGFRPSQVLDRGGVPNTLRAHEMALARHTKSGQRWASVTAGQQDILERSVKEQFIASLRRGTPQRFVKGAQAQIQKSADKARAAWKSIPFDQMPKLRLSLVEKRAQEIISESRYQEDLVPSIITRIADGKTGEVGEYLDMGSVQNLRSRLGAIIQDGADGGEKEIAAIKARELRGHLDDLIDGTFERGKNGRNRYGQIIDPNKKKQYKQWLDARQAWKEYKDLTDIDKLDGGDMIRLLHSKNPSIKIGATAVSSLADAQRAKQLSKSDRWTRQSLERSVQEYILGKPDKSTLTGFTKSPQSIRNTLSTYREGTVEILGEQYVKDLEKFIDLIETAKPGAIGPNEFVPRDHAALANKITKATGILARLGVKDYRGALRASFGAALIDELPSDVDAQFLMQVVAPDRELLRDMLRTSSQVDPTKIVLKLQRRLRVVQNQMRGPIAIDRRHDGPDIILEEEEEE